MVDLMGSEGGIERKLDVRGETGKPEHLKKTKDGQISLMRIMMMSVYVKAWMVAKAGTKHLHFVQALMIYELAR